MNVLRLGLLAVALTATPTSLLRAQTHERPSTVIWDSGPVTVTGGAGNKQRITLRIFQEVITHATGSRSWYLNYSVDAHDKKLLGNWKWASKLASISYSFTVTPGTFGVGGTHSGTVQLYNNYTSSGILFDGSTCDPTDMPVITSATVTATRSGGSSGISVTCTH